ncbi:uncharacterized protein FTOL_01956 [Fusarium torulosum]|uniref:Autophagy-related protein 27 n=1 Tax=Fusarium torulosum TaxID=33205 RepID=A0AAE8M1B3_9HYPO|nr:uncharacterized protein FTOL_01956 [Fusarium torulosum]
MKSLLLFTPLLLFPTFVLSACKAFKNTVSLEKYPPQKQVSRAINCTRENSKQDDTGRRYCDVDVYKMGIEVKTTTDFKLSEPLPVFELAREKSCNKSVLCDFNETVIIPFTLNETNSRVPENSTGYFAFTPEWKCVKGVIKDCKGDDERREGLRVRVCGYRLLTRGKNTTDPSGYVYAGNTTFVRVTTEEAEELGDERPWPSYEDAIKNKEEGEESGAMRNASMHTVVCHLLWSLFTVLFLLL